MNCEKTKFYVTDCRTTKAIIDTLVSLTSQGEKMVAQ